MAVTELSSRVFAGVTVVHETEAGKHRLRVDAVGGLTGDWFNAQQAAKVSHEGVDFLGFHPIVTKRLDIDDDVEIVLVDYGAAPA